MSRSGFLSIPVTILICGTLLFVQYQHNKELDEELSKERQVINLFTVEDESPPSHNISAEKPPTAEPSPEEGAASPGSSPEVTEARSIIKQLVAGIESPSSSPIELFKILPDILRVVQDLSIEQLLEVAEGLDESASPHEQSGEASVRSILHLLIADQDPSLIISNDDLMKNPEMRMGALASLSRQNPDAAGRWLESSDMPAQEKQHFKTIMLFQALRNNTEKGAEMLREMKKENGSSFQMSIPLPMETIADLQKSIENPKNEDIRDDLMGMMLTSAMVHSGIAGARETMERLEVNQEELSKVVSDVINRTDSMRTEPEETLAWLEEVQSPEDFQRTLPSAIGRWAATDFNAAGEWLGELEPSPSKDEAIQSFSSSIVNVDPEAAAIWSTQIQDEAQRLSSLQATVTTWQQVDPEAAQKWLETQGLDPAQFAPDPPTSSDAD